MRKTKKDYIRCKCNKMIYLPIPKQQKGMGNWWFSKKTKKLFMNKTHGHCRTCKLEWHRLANNYTYSHPYVPWHEELLHPKGVLA